MSKDFLENPYGVSGLVAAIIIMIIVYIVNHRIGKKKHLFDERYQHTTNRAKARSWDAMIVIYLAAWFVVIIFDGISFSFFLLTALYVLHNISLMVTTLYFNNREE